MRSESISIEHLDKCMRQVAIERELTARLSIYLDNLKNAQKQVKEINKLAIILNDLRLKTGFKTTTEMKSALDKIERGGVFSDGNLISKPDMKTLERLVRRHLYGDKGK